MFFVSVGVCVCVSECKWCVCVCAGQISKKWCAFKQMLTKKEEPKHCKKIPPKKINISYEKGSILKGISSSHHRFSGALLVSGTVWLKQLHVKSGKPPSAVLGKKSCTLWWLNLLPHWTHECIDPTTIGTVNLLRLQRQWLLDDTKYQ